MFPTCSRYRILQVKILQSKQYPFSHDAENRNDKQALFNSFWLKFIIFATTYKQTDNHSDINMGTNIQAISLTLGRGIGQVMLQNNALSGLLMLVGIFLNSWQMGLLTIGGNCISTLTAYLAGYRKEDIRNGLYGFNGTLVGIAAGAFLKLSPESLILTAIACCLSTWIASLFNRQHKLPGFTAPFILAVWILLGVCHLFAPELLSATASPAEESQSVHCFQTISMGIGQVMFQEHLLSGLFFLAGIGVHSRIAACYAFFGVILALPAILLPGIDAAILNKGLLGYNGVLCAIALGSTNLKSLGWAFLAVCLSILLQTIGLHAGLTTLTSPFIMAVWTTLLIRQMPDKVNNTTG